jgi:hypothetical protein
LRHDRKVDGGGEEPVRVVDIDVLAEEQTLSALSNQAPRSERVARGIGRGFLALDGKVVDWMEQVSDEQNGIGRRPVSQLLLNAIRYFQKVLLCR